MTKSQIVTSRLLRAVGSLAVLSFLASPAGALELREDFRELLRKYARGERSQAIAGLSALSDRDLERQLQAATALERSSDPAAKLTLVELRAAIMLHADTDRASAPISNEVEQPRACPGRIAFLGGRYAALHALRPDAGDFPQRFYLYMALRCQWDACLADGLQWGREALGLFPRDAKLLFAVGSILEETAVLGAGDITAVTAPIGAQQRALMMARVRETKKEAMFREARRYYESAVKIDPEADLARLRLGVVSWRLRELETAANRLREVTERSQLTRPLFLAHLFLGRVHEDESRLEEAEAEYRQALTLDPGAQSAAVALSHVLRLRGDGEGARQVLQPILQKAPRRDQRDAFWDYLGGSNDVPELLLDGLHREAEER
jgi:tetratricopeptide (TPR) repeat protein